MMKPRYLIVSATLMLLLIAGTSWAGICACCAERGTYDKWTGRPSQLQLEMISQMRFADKAQIYLTAAEFDSIRGIEALKQEYDRTGSTELGIVDVFTKDAWQLTFRSAGGQTGTLTLPRPAIFSGSRIDLFEPTEAEGNVVLYKEMAFKGNASIGTGFFRRDVIRSTAYSLIFQGRGNMCDDASDYSRWRLELNGQRAKYAFFGAMK